MKDMTSLGATAVPCIVHDQSQSTEKNKDGNVEFQTIYFILCAVVRLSVFKQQCYRVKHYRLTCGIKYY